MLFENKGRRQRSIMALKLRSGTLQHLLPVVNPALLGRRRPREGAFSLSPGGITELAVSNMVGDGLGILFVCSILHAVYCRRVARTRDTRVPVDLKRGRGFVIKGKEKPACMDQTCSGDIERGTGVLERGWEAERESWLGMIKNEERKKKSSRIAASNAKSRACGGTHQLQVSRSQSFVGSQNRKARFV